MALAFRQKSLNRSKVFPLVVCIPLKPARDSYQTLSGDKFHVGGIAGVTLHVHY